MRLLCFALLLVATTVLGTQGAMAAKFAKGDCVLINTYLEVVVGPDTTINGNWLAQDMHNGFAARFRRGARTR